MPPLRRSNRDRHMVYSSLKENQIGMESALIKSLVHEANKRDDYFLRRSGRKSRRKSFEEYVNYSPAHKSGEISEAELNDENSPHRSRRQCVLRRAVIYDEEFDDEPEDYYLVQRRSSRRVVDKRHQSAKARLAEEPQSSSRKPSRRSQIEPESSQNDEDSQLPEDEQLPEEEAEFSSLSERVKRRRQHQTEEFDETEAKKARLEKNLRSKRVKYEDEEDEVTGEDSQDAVKDEQDISARFSQTPEPDDNGKRYFFRRNRNQVIRLQDEFAKGRRKSRRSTRRSTGRTHSKRGQYRESSSSSTSDSDEDISVKDLKAEAKFERRKLKSLEKGRSKFLPLNMNAAEWKQRHQLNSLVSLNSAVQALGDIEPMGLDKSIQFKDIGGLDQHIQSLKEIVAFPLLYPEIFEKFHITAPKGVLFYGPPGTGKTLVARALANECSKDGKKVSFFMRKGADCMSKWVGESERQLRLLFDQAYQMRPSIIFFDEIDGLAPVRSSKQDQIHSSIVSTLLALMDGLDNRGEVVVIGATNRLDSIDPALRRPGRFDRELRFDLPDSNDRRRILDIHTHNWEQGKPPAELLDSLSEKTSGYCGADLKALCAEAVLVAVRNRYPHIYISDDKLALDPAQVQVEEWHFNEALRRIVPASRRGLTITSYNVNPRSSVFLKAVVQEVVGKIPSGYISKNSNATQNELEKVMESLRIPLTVPSHRLLLHSNGDQGQTRYYLPAIIRKLEHLPVFSVSFGQLFANSQPEENLSAVMLAITQATSRGSSALLVLSDIDVLESQLPASLWDMLVTSIERFDGFTPLLLLATSKTAYEECAESIKSLFKQRNALKIELPSTESRKEYFEQLVQDAFEEPKNFDPELHPAPPKVDQIPTSSAPRLTEPELKSLEKTYDQMQRQLRIFLRDILARLIRDRRFHVFHLPVSTEDAEDYYEIISNPMSLSDMMGKIDKKQYINTTEFLQDIVLIKDNAWEYNPATRMDDMNIRHNAAALLDTTAALFDAELDDDFEKKLTETLTLINETKDRLFGKKEEPRKKKEEEVPQEEEKDEDIEEKKPKSDKKLVIDKEKIDEAVEFAVTRTHDWTIQDIEALGVRLTQEIQAHRDEWDRSNLGRRLYEEVCKFEKD
ncbi:unnamed protein product [Bursaphelenchus xylophilus]|nr:unnamed protein product [Bursaphelenchus xylophilus]CAG9117882.1 unnamed protein product [Bursaphelenchus xylophilus]